MGWRTVLVRAWVFVVALTVAVADHQSARPDGQGRDPV